VGASPAGLLTDDVHRQARVRAGVLGVPGALWGYAMDMRVKRIVYMGYGWVAWKVTRRYARRRARKAFELLNVSRAA
jgi:hypothetical protein